MNENTNVNEIQLFFFIDSDQNLCFIYNRSSRGIEGGSNIKSLSDHF
jgi:hypothetical protein